MRPEEGPIAAFAQQVGAALPPGLFAEVQGLGQPDEFVRRSGWGLTWCSAPDDFAVRHPKLFEDLRHGYSDEVPCIDLTVMFDVGGRVSEAWLESKQLGLGLEGMSADQAAPLIASRIRVLLDEA